MQFTPSQEKALDLNRHLAILANAGAGKTRVLVERYVNILESYPELRPRNVVAITFTDAAAAELRARITRELDRRIEALDYSDARKLTLMNARDSMNGAAISTIHSFCKRLLRAYPIEAKVDASFSILQGPEQLLVLEDAITSVFYTILDRSYSDTPDQESLTLRRTFQTFGRQEMLRIMRAMFQNRSRVRLLADNLLKQPEENIIRFWKEQVVSSCESLLNEALKVLPEILSRAKAGKTLTTAQTAFASFTNAPDFFSRSSLFNDAWCSVFTGKGAVNKFLISDIAASGIDMEEIGHLCDSYKQAAGIIELIPATEEEFELTHQQYLVHLKNIFNLFGLIHQEYFENKQEHGLLDFDDLIERTERLTSNPEIQLELSERYPFIMIDEYQDTDETQYSIAKWLTGNFLHKNKLAIVGDPKQSIYCFRNAEATVFKRSLRSIVEQQLTPKALEESVRLGFSPEEERGELMLRENFRMTERPLAFVNHLFSRVMSQDFTNTLSTEEVAYSDLVAGREALSQGSVQWLVHPNEKPKKFDPDAEENENTEGESSEAELIAKKIRSIVTTEISNYQIDENDKLRAPNYSDIAVLLRTRAKLALIERALREQNIPYVVSKGSGFYSQPEILDLVSYLRFLVDPSDDVSLVAILRSPYFSISDTQLFQVAHFTRQVRDTLRPDRPLTFWERLNHYVIAHPDSEPLIRAAKTIQHFLELVGRVGASKLLEGLFAESAIYAILNAQPHGYQQIANIEKLQRLARQSDLSGFTTLYDFVDRINFLVERETAEAQAEAHPTGDAVKLMTVHAAKGLEFPIVIAAFLQQKFKFDNTRILDRDLGLLVNYPDGTSEKPAIAELIRLRAKANTIAEEKRIFYVALTRARDHLILSATLDAKPPSESWLGWTMKVWGGELQTTNSLQIDETILRYDGRMGVTREQPVRFPIPITREPTEITITETAEKEAESPKLPIFYLDPIPLTRQIDRFSATQFLTYQQCATKYHLAYVLGIPQEPRLAQDLEPDQDAEKLKGVMVGQVIHQLFERIDELAIADSVDIARFQSVFESVCTSLGLNDPDEIKVYEKRSLDDLQRFVRSKLGQKSITARETHRELPVQLAINSDIILFGIIDRLFLDADGIWHIVDYKTENPESARSKQMEPRYKFQLKFYAYLVSRLYDTAEIRATLFFSKNGTSKEYTFRTEDFKNFKAECDKLISGIRVNEHASALELIPKNQEHCPECSFFDLVKRTCISPGGPIIPVKREAKSRETSLQGSLWSEVS